jgi:hypothetical protein
MTIEEWIERQLAAAPPLTSDQRNRITALLSTDLIKLDQVEAMR